MKFFYFLVAIILISNTISLKLGGVSNLNNINDIEQMISFLSKSSNNNKDKESINLEKPNTNKQSELDRMEIFKKYLIDKDQKNSNLNNKKQEINDYLNKTLEEDNKIINIQNQLKEIKELVSKSASELIEKENNNSLSQTKQEIMEQKKLRLNTSLHSSFSSISSQDDYEGKFNYYIAKLNTLSEIN